MPAPPTTTTVTAILTNFDPAIQSSSGSTTPSWAVPVATLVGAIIAATVLLINESRKARRDDRQHRAEFERDDRQHREALERQDRRQWDRDIRDAYADLTRITREVDDIRTKLKRITSISLSDESDMQNAGHNRSFHEAVWELHEKSSLIASQVEVIADPETSKAFADVDEGIRRLAASLHDGIYSKDIMRPLWDAQHALLPTIRKSLRIDTAVSPD